jgi:hypothetical protein
MSENEKYLDVRETVEKYREILNIFSSVFGKYNAENLNIGDNTAIIQYYEHNIMFKFSKLNFPTSSFIVERGDWTTSPVEFGNMKDLTDTLNYCNNFGFTDSYGDLLFFDENQSSDSNSDSYDSSSSGYKTPSYDEDLDLDEDEEIDEDDSDFKRGSKPISIQSIVPHDIQKIRVVALRYGGRVIAFRFKTDKGAYDMRIEVATRFGLGGFKTEKFITLENVNGILMSISEKKQRVCVPDISLCEEDCKRLIDRLFDE